VCIIQLAEKTDEIGLLDVPSRWTPGVDLGKKWDIYSAFFGSSSIRIINVDLAF